MREPTGKRSAGLGETEPIAAEIYDAITEQDPELREFRKAGEQDQAVSLLSRLRREHEERFTLLQERLNRFIEPAEIVRSRYFPQSLIFRYDSYAEVECDRVLSPSWMQGNYQRALLMQ